MQGEYSLNRFNGSPSGAIEELDFNFETSSIEESENLRLEIEKLRAATEDQIFKLREEYLQKESELINHLSNEKEKKIILDTRPDFLFCDTLSLDDHRNSDFIEKESSKRMP